MAVVVAVVAVLRRPALEAVVLEVVAAVTQDNDDDDDKKRGSNTKACVQTQRKTIQRPSLDTTTLLIMNSHKRRPISLVLVRPSASKMGAKTMEDGARQKPYIGVHKYIYYVLCTRVVVMYV